MYRFQHIVTDMVGNEIMEINVTLPEGHHDATALVENFVCFLQGCGFAKESILSAMAAEAVLEEP